MHFLYIRRIEKVLKEIQASCSFVGLASTLILSSLCIAGEGSPMLAEGRAGDADPGSIFGPAIFDAPDPHQSFKIRIRPGCGSRLYRRHEPFIVEDDATHIIYIYPYISTKNCLDIYIFTKIVASCIRENFCRNN
jgi:hypothetical protein